MPRLSGAQRMILQTVLSLSVETEGFVTDEQIARATNIPVSEVRDWVETLEGAGFLDVARTSLGLAVCATAGGRLALGKLRPFLTPHQPATPISALPFETVPVKPPPAFSAPGELVEIFYSFSHEDDALRDELDAHLLILKRERVITGWHHRRIGAGEDWKGQIDGHLDSAKLVLLLISPSFLASDYCCDIELTRALERDRRREARVIPILLCPAALEGAPFEGLQLLPRDGRPVTTWPNQDEAFRQVAKEIRAAVDALRASRS